MSTWASRKSKWVETLSAASACDGPASKAATHKDTCVSDGGPPEVDKGVQSVRI